MTNNAPSMTGCSYCTRPATLEAHARGSAAHGARGVLHCSICDPGGLRAGIASGWPTARNQRTLWEGRGLNRES